MSYYLFAALRDYPIMSEYLTVPCQYRLQDMGKNLNYHLMGLEWGYHQLSCLAMNCKCFEIWQYCLELKQLKNRWETTVQENGYASKENNSDMEILSSLLIRDYSLR